MRRFCIAFATTLLLLLNACSTAAPIPAVAPPASVVITDQNGNVITSITDSHLLQPISAFINNQRTHKPWRTHDPEPIADVVLHFCQGGKVESTFGTQTRLFIADSREDTPAQPNEVDDLLGLIGQERSIFTRVPLQQSHSQVSCP